MDYSHNVLQQQLRQQSKNDYTNTYNTNIAKSPLYVGSLDSCEGRFGVYGECRIHDMFHTLNRSLSFPNLNNQTKRSFTRSRSVVGR